jgi:hypothetical protein
MANKWSENTTSQAIEKHTSGIFGAIDLLQTI